MTVNELIDNMLTRLNAVTGVTKAVHPELPIKLRNVALFTILDPQTMRALTIADMYVVVQSRVLFRGGKDDSATAVIAEAISDALNGVYNDGDIISIQCEKPMFAYKNEKQIYHYNMNMNIKIQ